jgi:hypothetical protein
LEKKELLDLRTRSRRGEATEVSDGFAEIRTLEVADEPAGIEFAVGVRGF